MPDESWPLARVMRGIVEILRVLLSAALFEIGFWFTLAGLLVFLFVVSWAVLGSRMFATPYFEIIMTGIVCLLIGIAVAMGIRLIGWLRRTIQR